MWYHWNLNNRTNLSPPSPTNPRNSHNLSSQPIKICVVQLNLQNCVVPLKSIKFVWYHWNLNMPTDLSPLQAPPTPEIPDEFVIQTAIKICVVQLKSLSKFVWYNWNPYRNLWYHWNPYPKLCGTTEILNNTWRICHLQAPAQKFPDEFVIPTAIKICVVQLKLSKFVWYNQVPIKFCVVQLKSLSKFVWYHWNLNNSGRICQFPSPTNPRNSQTNLSSQPRSCLCGTTEIPIKICGTTEAYQNLWYHWNPKQFRRICHPSKPHQPQKFPTNLSSCRDVLVVLVLLVLLVLASWDRKPALPAKTPRSPRPPPPCPRRPYCRARGEGIRVWR